MKLPVLFASLFSLFILASCSSSKKASADLPAANHIQNSLVKEISVDGNDADWQGITLNSSPEKTFQYSIAHNNEDLFVRMKISNPLEQMKFLSGGMELWIDPTDQQKQKVEVIYPTKGELDPTAMQPQNASGDKKQNHEMMHLAVKAQLISMNRIGFKPEYSGVQSIRENTGFKAAISWNDNDELIYELKLPFQAFNGTVSKENLSLEFSIGALERPAESHNNSENGGSYRQGGMSGMRGGGGGYRGGGQGHYGGGERSGQRGNNSTDTNKTDWQKMREKESFWVQCSA
jgi:hypothetical protein